MFEHGLYTPNSTLKWVPMLMFISGILGATFPDKAMLIVVQKNSPQKRFPDIWLEMFGTCFPHFFWECHHPNWRSPSFFRGVGQPPTRYWRDISSYNFWVGRLANETCCDMLHPGNWLVVWNIFFYFPIFSPIAGMMIQSDFHIFQRDWNHQLGEAVTGNCPRVRLHRSGSLQISPFFHYRLAQVKQGMSGFRQRRCSWFPSRPPYLVSHFTCSFSHPRVGEAMDETSAWGGFLAIYIPECSLLSF